MNAPRDMQVFEIKRIQPIEAQLKAAATSRISAFDFLKDMSKNKVVSGVMGLSSFVTSIHVRKDLVRGYNER